MAGQVAADIGFGGGPSLALLLDRVRRSGRVHGLDLSRVMLDRARRRHRRPITQARPLLHEASPTDLPLPDASVEAAMTISTHYFVPDDVVGDVFAELARIPSPTGRLVVGLGDPAAMAREPVTAHGFRIRPTGEVEAAHKVAGLRHVEHRRVGSGPDAFHLLVAQPTAT